jgi:hypothetical protein
VWVVRHGVLLPIPLVTLSSIGASSGWAALIALAACAGRSLKTGAPQVPAAHATIPTPATDPKTPAECQRVADHWRTSQLEPLSFAAIGTVPAEKRDSASFRVVKAGRSIAATYAASAAPKQVEKRPTRAGSSVFDASLG